MVVGRTPSYVRMCMRCVVLSVLGGAWWCCVHRAYAAPPPPRMSVTDGIGSAMPIFGGAWLAGSTILACQVMLMGAVKTSLEAGSGPLGVGLVCFHPDEALDPMEGAKLQCQTNNRRKLAQAVN